MISKYKDISIIYGGSGYEYAKTLDEMIRRLQTENRYPFISSIVMEKILTGEILTSVINIFKNSDICIAILTADDTVISNGSEKLRLRQNVVFELGMALFHLGKGNCIVLSDFDTRSGSFDMPSDLTGIEITYFEKDDFENTAKDVLKKLINLSSDTNAGEFRYDNLLHRKNYYVDYRSLLGANGKDLSESNAGLERVLDIWTCECSSLLHYDEKVMYFLERIGFIPLFGSGCAVDRWYDETKKIVSGYTVEDVEKYGKKKDIDAVRELALLTLEYSGTKADPNASVEDYEDYYSRFELLDFGDEASWNPLVMTIYHDYFGLTCNRLCDQTGDISYAIAAKEHFEKAVEFIDRVDVDMCVWEGYLRFNIARALFRIMELGKDDSLCQRLLEEYKRAVLIRRRWLENDEFGIVLRNALSYEYFIAKEKYIFTQNKLNRKTYAETVREYEKLESELSAYISKDSLGDKLMQIQATIITNKNKLQ